MRKRAHGGATPSNRVFADSIDAIKLLMALNALAESAAG